MERFLNTPALLIFSPLYHTRSHYPVQEALGRYTASQLMATTGIGSWL